MVRYSAHRVPNSRDRSHGGQFILRIDDTDSTRNQAGGVLLGRDEAPSRLEKPALLNEVVPLPSPPGKKRK